MPAILVRDAIQSDVDHVADHLREADMIELRAAGFTDPAGEVRRGWTGSDWTRSVLVDGVPSILYGVAPTGLRGCGSPWMLATDGIRAITRPFLLGSRGEVERMRAAYGFLVNQVHQENALSIRWLKWLGFTIDLEPAGRDGQFFTFTMGALNV
jgi:hypothetical protein